MLYFSIARNIPVRSLPVCNQFYKLKDTAKSIKFDLNTNFSSELHSYSVVNVQNQCRKYRLKSIWRFSSTSSKIFDSKIQPQGLTHCENDSLKRFKLKPVPSFKGVVEIPKEPLKLKFIEKVPHPIAGVRQRKMPKDLHYIRGEEEVHTDFLYGQYGIVAQRGGLLKHGHFEMMRMGISRKINYKRSFAIWRIEAPWKSHTKKGIGKRMGGGKGSISFYTTPVKAKRVILEVAGKVTFEEVKRMLDIIAQKLPFPATVMTQQMIEEERREQERLKKENINPYTFKYILQNNILGSQMWAKKHIDMKYFGQYD